MRLVLLTVLVLLAGCADAPVEPPAAPTAADSTADLSAFFPEGTEGAFVLYDARSGITTRYNPARAAEPRTPASTSKIFNTMAFLDAGVVEDEHEVIGWDGVERRFPQWNESQDLATAFQRSTVWVYQELARRAGRDTLQAFLTREGYGNATIGDAVDLFWLDGSLRISPDEQVAFLRKLYDGGTGFSDRAEGIVREIMVADTTGGMVTRGKTGWSWHEGENLGWWIGWVERGEAVHVFALQVESEDPEFDMVGVRKEAASAILRHLGVG